MPKLAIYVPKKDLRVIEKWRKKINFSKVFMRALSDEIRDRSRVVDTDDAKLTAAAEYYRRKLADGSEPLIDFGHQLGSRHVIDCQLSPDSIRQVMKIKESETWQPEDVAAIEETIGDDLQTIDDLLTKNDYDEQSRATWRHVVYRGYLQGVAAAWQRVCEHM